MKKKVKKFSLKEQYKLSWNYIKECRNFIWLVLGFFIFAALIGFFISPSELISEKIMEFIQEILEKTAGMSSMELICFIFLNNLKSSFMGLILGFFLGIFPVIATLVNGYLLGFVSLMAVESEGVLSLWRLFPHGIFELPAVFISLGMGLKFGTFLFEKNKLKSFKDFLKNSLRVFVFVIIPLLLVAGIIEGLLIFI